MLARPSTDLVYFPNSHLFTETVATNGQPTTQTLYTYDKAGNRSTKVEKTDGVVDKDVEYTYNVANQLTNWVEKDGLGATLRSAALAYDDNGNRESQTITVGLVDEVTTYAWTSENRLASVTLPDTSIHSYTYDYRVRRLSRTEPAGTTAVAYSGGLSVAEYAVATATTAISNPASSVVEYQRGPDMGGGVGGLLYSLRSGTPKFNLSNGRGDVVAQSDSDGDLTWTASYEAYGKRPVETGTNADRQRANTKEEDPTGLLNEGFRYRDIETGVWLSRDPAGFVDGPNLYAYVRQNPWTAFDPDGLNDTFGWNNWFADWVLPDPVGSYNEAGQNMDMAFGVNGEDGWERASGAFGALGHSISCVVDCVPGLGKAKSQLFKKLAQETVEEGAERGLKHTLRHVDIDAAPSLRRGPLGERLYDPKKLKDLAKGLSKSGIELVTNAGDEIRSLKKGAAALFDPRNGRILLKENATFR